MRFRGDVRFGKRYEDRQHTDRPGRSRDQGERSHDQDGRSRDQGGRSRGQDGRSHDQGGRSHDQDGRSRDHDERSEGRSRDRDRRLGGRSQAQHEQPNRYSAVCSWTCMYSVQYSNGVCLLWSPLEQTNSGCNKEVAC